MSDKLMRHQKNLLIGSLCEIIRHAAIAMLEAGEQKNTPFDQIRYVLDSYEKARGEIEGWSNE